MTPRQFKVCLCFFTFMLCLMLGVYWMLAQSPEFIALAAIAVGICITYCLFF